MGNAAEAAGGRGTGGSPGADTDAINDIFAASGVGPLTSDELAAASSALSRGDKVPIVNLPRNKQTKIEVRRLGVTTQAKSRGCRGLCTALAAEIRIEHDCFTESAASGTKKISPDYGLVESLCGLLCGMVEGIFAEKIETYLDNELREVVALMALAMDMMRKARRVERMKLLGDSYVGLQPDSLMDTDSDAGSEDSMSDHDDADAGFAAHDSNSMPDDHDARVFHAGTNDEDKYVNPDEGVIVDRGKQRACFMSLRACCEFLSSICQQRARYKPGEDLRQTAFHMAVRNAIKTSGAVVNLARLLRLNSRDNELMFWGLNALFFCLRDGSRVDHDNVRALRKEGKGNRLTEKLRRSCRKDPLMKVHLKCIKNLLDKRDTAEAAARDQQEESVPLAVAASRVREVGGTGFGGRY